MPSTALTLPKALTRFCTRIMGDLLPPNTKRFSLVVKARRVCEEAGVDGGEVHEPACAAGRIRGLNQDRPNRVLWKCEGGSGAVSPAEAPGMLLTITTTHRPATDLGYLLHKHLDRVQSFELSFGKAHVYYPEVGAERCTACLLLDVDSVGMVRGKNPDQSFLLAQYVNDRPYAASSFMSVAT